MHRDDEFEFDLSRRLQQADDAIRREREQAGYVDEFDLGDDWGLWDADEAHEAFVRDMEAFESGERVTLYNILTGDGVALPPEHVLDDEEIHAKLQEIVLAMEARRAYLYATDHLSDRELYIKLLDDIFQEETFLPSCQDSAVHFDLLGSGSDEDTSLWLKYYADEEERERWAREFPDDPMPEAEKPPFDRDRFLPQRRYW